MLSAIRARGIREIALSTETYWKPFHPRTLMAVELSGSGKTQSGLHVVENTERRKFLAHVLVVNDCETVQAGDFILFEDGTQEPLVTATGEEFVVIREDMVTDIVMDYALVAEEPMVVVP